MRYSDRLTACDFFSGAGGLSEGFKQAGFEIVLGVDTDEAAVATYHQQHGCGLLKNIERIDAAFVKKITGLNRIDVVVGGPPCQGFSTVAVGKLKSNRHHLLYLHEQGKQIIHI